MSVLNPPPHFESSVFSRFDAVQARFKPDVPRDDPRLLAILRHLGPIAGKVVLDLGCGKGRFAARFLEEKARVIGIDPSGGMLLAARDAGLAVAKGSARRVPMADASVDRVVLIEVIEHVEAGRVGETLREAARVLRPGGTIVIVDKNAASLDPVRPWLPAILVKRIDEARGRGMYPRGSLARECWFWPGQVEGRLRRAGFEGVRTERILGRAEEGRPVFGRFPIARRFVVWSARRPGEQGR